MGLLLLGFGLRTYALGSPSIWGDEGYSIFYGHLSFAGVLAAVKMEVTMPPLYYLALKYWMLLAGDGEFSVRFLSAWFGLLAVPASYQLGSRLLSSAGGLAAGLMTSTAPFLVYYSQEARPYGELGGLATLSFLLGLMVLSPGTAAGGRASRIARQAGYVGITLATILTYYFAGFMVLAQTIWLLLSRPNRRLVVRWVGLLAAVGLLLLPWLAYMAVGLVGLGSNVEHLPLAPGALLGPVFTAYSVGTSIDPEIGWPLTIGLGVVAVLGVLTSPSRSRVALLLWLAIPIALIGLVGFTAHLRWQRYFTIASLPYYLLLASATAWLHGRRPVAGLIFGLAVVGVFAVGLRGYYGDPRFARYDYRGAVANVLGQMGAEDLLVRNGPTMAFDYYYRDPSLKIPADALATLAAHAWEADSRNPALGIPPDGESLGASLQRLRGELRPNRNVWLIKYMPPDFDPGDQVEQTLIGCCYRYPQRWLENLTLTQFRVPPGAPELTGTPNWQFSGGLRLASYGIGQRRLSPGEPVAVGLQWRADGPVGGRYTAFLHVVDSTGHQVAQHDAEPGERFFPTNGLQPGQGIGDRRAVALPSTLSAGLYSVELGLYETGTTRPVPVLVEGLSRLSVPLGQVAIRPAAGDAIPSTAKSADVHLADTIALRAHDASLAGSRAIPQLNLTLYWQAMAKAARDWTVFVHVEDAAGHVLAQHDGQPVSGAYPTSLWQVGEVVADTYQIPLPSTFDPNAAIQVGMYDLSSGERLVATLNGQRLPDDSFSPSKLSALRVGP